jgi:hypothetical protein
VSRIVHQRMGSRGLRRTDWQAWHLIASVDSILDALEHHQVAESAGRR